MVSAMSPHVGYSKSRPGFGSKRWPCRFKRYVFHKTCGGIEVHSLPLCFSSRILMPNHILRSFQPKKSQEKEDEDGFAAEYPSLSGCVGQGSTRQEALGNIEEAIAGYLENLKKHHEPIPPLIWEEGSCEMTS